MHAEGTLELSLMQHLTLVAMQDAAKFGLAYMPAVEPAIVALIVLPDEALSPDARCP